MTGASRSNLAKAKILDFRGDLGSLKQKGVGMNVWVYVDRKKAILAGKNVDGWQLVDVDMSKLSQREREYVADCRVDWFVACGSNRDNRIKAQVIENSVAEATEASVVEAIREHIIVIERQMVEIAAEKKKSEEDMEKEIVALLNGRAEECLRKGRGNDFSKELEEAVGDGYRSYWSVWKKFNDPRLEAKYAEAEKIATERNEEETKKCESAIAEMVAAKKIREGESKRVAAEKKAQISKWVSENGTDNQKKRHEIGLLPKSEVLDSIQNDVYGVLNIFPQYETMEASDVCVCDDYGRDECCDVRYEVLKATEATSDEYEKLSQISKTVKSVHPDAIVTMMDHVGTSVGCRNTTTRKSVKVEIPVGVFSFSREYSV